MEEIKKPTDWNEVRIQAAIAFGQALINGLSYRPSWEEVAPLAVRYADALIIQLKD